MKINGKNYTTIWESADQSSINIIDQRFLPFKFEIKQLRNYGDVVTAIKIMMVRGAPLIGVTSAYGIYLAALEAPKNHHDFMNYLKNVGNEIISARQTAINARWAVQKIINEIQNITSYEDKISKALQLAREIRADDIEKCRKIGEYGVEIIKKIAAEKKGNPVNILTHCNAGWLATIDWGTATAPIYAANSLGINLHVWVDETRPLYQGARLTSWELFNEGIPNTIITDNAGGHIMQNGLVDLVIVGSDRTTINGYVANKIGTYLKALAAYDNNIPFYVALPSSTIDWSEDLSGMDIPIEIRSDEEILKVNGWDGNEIKTLDLTYPNAKALNYAFDITPPKYVTALITERGICKPNEDDILKLFPEIKNG